MFSPAFISSVSKIKVGNGLEDKTVSGPLIDEYSLAKVEEHVNDAKEKGASVNIGGKVHELGGNFYEPTVLSNVPKEAKITYEETFGPVSQLYKFTNEK